MELKKTKIIATLGPSSKSLDTIEKMVKAGANLFRINTSHGSRSTVAALVKKVRQVEKKLHTFIGILLDLQGPKIRIGKFERGFIEIHQKRQGGFNGRPEAGGGLCGPFICEKCR